MHCRDAGGLGYKFLYHRRKNVACSVVHQRSIIINKSLLRAHHLVYISTLISSILGRIEVSRP